MSVTSQGVRASGDAARPARRWRRFRRDGRGSVAVEFGLLALPFLSLVYAIFETSMVHMTGQVMQTAISDASRLIMTGQAQNANMTAAQFKDQVCKRVTALFNCQRDLTIDVRVYTSFSAATVSAPPIKADKTIDTSSMGFTMGGPNEIVVVRAFLAYPIIVPLVGQTLVNLAGNKRLIMASAAFKNEPYASSP